MAFSSVSVVSNSLRLKRKKITGKEGRTKALRNKSLNTTTMKREFKVEGMMCDHCRMHVERALNSMDGVKATVTLDPPVATVEFEGTERTLEDLQRVVTERAGAYALKV